MKKLLVAAMVALSIIGLSACKGGDDGLDTEVAGEIDLVTWAGNDIRYLNIGQQNFLPEDLTSKKVASIFATAKAFNEIYPNVKINYYGKPAGPDDGGVVWDQTLANYKDKYDVYPAVFAISDTVALLKQGVLADLSIYEDDDLYQTLNPGLLEQANYYGMQAALPGYFIPSGMFINPGIITDEFLDEVSPDWTFDEFTDLVTNGEGLDDGYSGLGALPSTWMKQMFIYDALYDFGEVDLNTQEVKDFLSDGMEVWNDYQFYSHEEDYQSVYQSWSINAFSAGVVTVYPEDAWYLDAFAIQEGTLPGPEGFDVYPYPDYNGRGNTISTVTDPLGVYNYCNDDGNPECNEEEQLKLDIAYEFASFMIADTRAWKARAEVEYGEIDTDGNLTVLTGAADASLPVTVGDAFNEQLAYWYQIGSNGYYEDKEGFNAVLDIIRSGEVKAISDKVYPWFFTDETTETRQMIFEEFWFFYDVDETPISAPEWQDLIFSKLDSWTDLFNDRLALAWTEIENALVDYYGYDTDDARFSE
ncbi:hypothetical protein [Candidatus Xianfuyuplasma coldseepsis]|uniref:ABC transporter substrate-binding protein n=1 Tax=Candidatus Xianfuyuplasma coldseepsis TaxID=2782163 RepID=A0A7L7KPG3_9MOLU|nr:hypothetical protein [Xianfuyuplasma coldseepsis]QMS84435.1 hypothetical protein G4Z02_01310 [Xianfuyuplasma coldseepsis]